MHNNADFSSTPAASHASLHPVLSLGGAGGASASCFEAEPANPVQQEQAMWRAVIVQALMDAACGSQKYEAQQARNEALIWLRGTSQDFATVCYYAGYEPDFVRRMVKKSLDEGCRWRALPGEGKRLRHSRPRTERTARHRR